MFFFLCLALNERESLEAALNALREPKLKSPKFLIVAVLHGLCQVRRALEVSPLSAMTVPGVISDPGGRRLCPAVHSNELLQSSSHPRPHPPVQLSHPVSLSPACFHPRGCPALCCFSFSLSRSFSDSLTLSFFKRKAGLLLICSLPLQRIHSSLMLLSLPSPHCFGLWSIWHAAIFLPTSYVLMHFSFLVRKKPSD